MGMLLDVDDGGNDMVIPKANIVVLGLFVGLELEGDYAGGVADKDGEQGFVRGGTMGCKAKNVIDIFFAVIALVESDAVFMRWK